MSDLLTFPIGANSNCLSKNMEKKVAGDDNIFVMPKIEMRPRFGDQTKTKPWSLHLINKLCAQHIKRLSSP